LRNAVFESAEFGRASFAQAILVGASFTKAEVNRSTFEGADLTGVDMSKAELARTSFAKAKAGAVNFSYSNLARADLRGVPLPGANLTGTYLYLTLIAGADLSQATGLKQEQLDLACGSNETRLPPGLKGPQSWPCSETPD
jgi:uncharacterized protein YjbI with pentapeptide repeats